MRSTVMDIAITGPTDERELKVLGQRVRDEIAALPSVTQVELLNTRPYEVSIEVSEASLRRNGLSFEQVAAAVRSASLDLPGGSIKTDGGEILLRTKGQAYWGDEFEQLVVRTRIDGTRVLLRDVAKVIDGFEDTDQQVRFNGKRAAIIRVSRIGDQDILEITAALNGYLAAAPEHLPAGVELTIWSDGSLMLRDRLDTLLGSARQGFLMVLLLLALFLRPRLSFWVSVGVPASFLGAVWLIWVLGMSIDGISLFGFILVLGILVDDAIVIGESVYSRQQSEGSWLPAAIAGTREVSVPVIFGVLTTVAAFTPLLLGTGMFGQIQSVIATVVMCCLLFSLVESQLVLPAHLGHRHAETPAAEVGLMLIPVLGVILLGIAWDLRSYIALAVGCASVILAWHLNGGFDRAAAALIELQSRFSAGLERFIHGRFRQVVGSAVDRRYTTAAIAVFVLLATLGVLASGRLPFSFFPPLESDQVTAKLTMPLGTAASVTQDAVLQLEKTANEVAAVLADEADALPPVTHILAAIGGHPVSSSGQGFPSGGGGANQGGHLGEVTMQLTPGQAREIETRDVAERWREVSGTVPDAVELTFETSLLSAGEAIDIQLEGAELDELREIAAEIRETLAEYPGVIDIADSFRS
ncbi:MAG: efflux RND transporter permease subunit, partial [Myxococcota bacterium]